jgi:hypothetical protein
MPGDITATIIDYCQDAQEWESMVVRMVMRDLPLPTAEMPVEELDRNGLQAEAMMREGQSVRPPEPPPPPKQTLWAHLLKDSKGDAP